MTVAEFSAAAGISKQAVYKQVANSGSQLARFVVRQGKKSYIRSDALELYADAPQSTLSTNLQPESQPISTENSTDSTSEVENSTNSTENSTQKSVEVEFLLRRLSAESAEKSTAQAALVDFLKTQINALEVEKDRLNGVIAEKDAMIRQQSERLADLTQQVTGLVEHALVATTQQQVLTAADKATVQQSEPGFWRKLFGRKP